MPKEKRYYRGYYNGEQIMKALKRGEIFVNAEDINLDRVNPAGIDLTLDKVLDTERVPEAGDEVLFYPSQWPQEALLQTNEQGFYYLKSGKRYLASFNEILKPGEISLEIEAKSSFTRGGCGIRNHYYGYDPLEDSEPRQGFVTLDIFNPYGFSVQDNVFFVQAVIWSDKLMYNPGYEQKTVVSEPLIVGEVKEFMGEARYAIKKKNRNLKVTQIIKKDKGSVVLRKQHAYLISFTEQVIDLGPDQFTAVWPTSLILDDGRKVLVYGAYGDPGFRGTYSALVVPVSDDIRVKIGEPISEKLRIEFRNIPELKSGMLYSERSGNYQEVGIKNDRRQDKIKISEKEIRLEEVVQDVVQNNKNISIKRGKSKIANSLGLAARALRRDKMEDFWKQLTNNYQKGFKNFLCQRIGQNGC